LNSKGVLRRVVWKFLMTICAGLSLYLEFIGLC
jgi:hypothetical protein